MEFDTTTRQQAFGRAFAARDIVSLLPGVSNLPTTGIPGLPDLLGLAVTKFDFSLINPSDPRQGIQDFQFGLVSGTPWQIFGSPTSFTIDAFSFSLQATRNSTTGSLMFRGNVVGIMLFPRSGLSPVRATIYVPFPMTLQDYGSLILPTATSGNALTLLTFINSFPISIPTDILNNIPGVNTILSTVAVTQLDFCVQTGARRRRAVSLPYFNFQVESTEPWSFFGETLQLANFKMNIKKVGTVKSGFINGTVRLNARGRSVGVDLSFPFPLGIAPLRLTPARSSDSTSDFGVVKISDILALIPGTAGSVNFGSSDFGGAPNFPNPFDFEVVFLEIDFNAEKRFNFLHFAIRMTRPWAFALGGSSRQFVLSNVDFEFMYRPSATPKVSGYINTAFSIDSTPVNITVWIPFTTRSTLPLFVYPPANPSGRALELVGCPRPGTLSINCSNTKSLELGVAPARILDSNGNWVANPAALTVGKIIKWVLPDGFGDVLKQVGLVDVLDLFAITELQYKAQGSLLAGAIRFGIEQTAPWSLFGGRLVVSNASIAIRRSVINNVGQLQGEIYGGVTLKAHQNTPSGCSDSSLSIDAAGTMGCPVTVKMSLSFPLGRMQNSIEAVNALTGAPSLVTMKHLIYTFVGLDLEEQSWNFPVDLPDEVDKIFSAWMNIGLEYVRWTNFQNGSLERLEAKLTYPGRLDICFDGLGCFLKCSSMSIKVTKTPSRRLPVFNAIGNCQPCLFGACQKETVFDEVFPPKSGSLSTGPTILSMRVTFYKVPSGSFFTSDLPYVNFSIAMDRSKGFTSLKNGYVLRCQGRTLNLTQPSMMWNNDSGYEYVTFGEHGSKNNWVEFEEDLSNTRFVAPLSNYGLRRYFRCQVCTKRLTGAPYCGDWFSNATYSNSLTDSLDTDGEDQIVLKTRGDFSTTETKANFKTYNPVVVMLPNGTAKAIANISLKGFQYIDGSFGTDLGSTKLYDNGKAISVSSLKLIKDGLYQLELTGAGPHDIYWQNVFVMEILVIQATYNVADTVITFNGVFPYPMERGRKFHFSCV